MPAMTRGPLPPGVYWRRRAFVGLLAVTLVFIIASLLSGGSDGKSDEGATAQQAAGQVQASQTVTVGKKERKGRKKDREPEGPTAGPSYDPTVLVEPEGPCDPEDVVVTPSVETAVAGRDVTVSLSLQTVEAEACNWQVGARRVTLKITDGDDEVWSTRHCPRAMPQEAIVVRRIVATVVELTWNARFSDDDCPRVTDWVEAGDYTLTAAAYRGEPVSTDFTLVNPTAETTTAEPEPDPDREQDGDRKADRKADRKGQQRGDGGSDDPSENRDGDEPVR